MKDAMHKKCSQLFKSDKDSCENEFDELNPRMCEVDEELDTKQDTVQNWNLCPYIL